MFDITYYSAKGAQRAINQDNILIDTKIPKESGSCQCNKEHFLVAVADGMGGHSKGEVASLSVLDYLRKHIPKDARELIHALLQTHTLLEEIAKSKNIQLGTAIATVLYTNGRFFIANVGDCRVYKITAQNEILQISQDHTLINQLKALHIPNKILREQKNILTSSISGGLDNEDFEIFQTNTLLEENEKLVLCSDGFWNLFEDDLVALVSKKRMLKYFDRISKNRDLNDDCTFVILQKSQEHSKTKQIFKKMLNFIKILGRIAEKREGI